MTGLESPTALVCSGLVLILALGVAGCTPADTHPMVWRGGQPPELSKDNPYLPRLNQHVVRARQQLKRGKPEHPFYLVWGATAPGSTHRDDASLRTLALEEFDKATLARAEKPQGFWSIYGDLEALYLWQLEGKVPRETIVTWQRRLRPSIELNIKTVTDQESWISRAANTLLQSTVILELAALSYSRTDPSDPAPARWREQARANFAKARAIKLPGGAFSYIRHSGPDPCYFNFDTAHLGRYYQLTGAPEARRSLVEMAEWAGAATRCGWLTPFSSPWWKHIVGTGGPYTGPEYVSTLADDPTARGVMAKRRSYIQPYVWSYTAMYAWEKPDGPIEPIGDRCTFDRNAAGPALRRGGFDVEMPARAWGDSMCGMSYATEKAITSCINAVVLTANKSEAKPGLRRGSHAYIMLDETAPDTHANVVGQGWIAAANSVDTHLGLYGDIPPKSSPWKRTELWYADEDGVAGSLELTCREADEVQGIELWVSHKSRDARPGLSSVVFKDFELHLQGNRFETGTTTKKGPIIYFPLKGAGKRTYRPGERFAAQVCVQRPGRPKVTMGPIRRGDAGVIEVEVFKDGVPHVTLVYSGEVSNSTMPRNLLSVRKVR